jgi:hypothetical protein
MADQQALTKGKVGLEPHSVQETQRIALGKKLEAFRDDASATVLEFPAKLDSTERKYLHTLCKSLGLESKSSGKVRVRIPL